MRYIRVDRNRDGFSIDASAYLEQLPRLAPQLPSGARQFATDPQHYDFHSRRFIKNLTPRRMLAGHQDGVAWLELKLRHNCWRHDEDLTIRYDGVHKIVLTPPADDVAVLGEVLLDEALPTAQGCHHEIACVGGSITVVCRDLTATWAQADCVERDSHP